MLGALESLAYQPPRKLRPREWRLVEAHVSTLAALAAEKDRHGVNTTAHIEAAAVYDEALGEALQASEEGLYRRHLILALLGVFEREGSEGPTRDP